LVASDNKPVALWAVPRSISTAFERVFVERDDFEVLHEPFSASYYYGQDRLSDRYADVESRAENNYERVLESVLAPRAARVFLKDMAYHAKGVISSSFAASFVNTFIIRDPKYVIASMYKMWPDFTLEETGFEQIYNLFRYATEVNGEDVVVVDAMTFASHSIHAPCRGSRGRCAGGTTGTGGMRRRSRAQASSGPNAGTRFFRTRRGKLTSTACPTTTSSPPTPSQPSIRSTGPAVRRT
jgi:hypothetical protein